ncbi:MAG: type II toxin-antitoxin system VapC family toxin [Ornithinimicrobium sp.]
MIVLDASAAVTWLLGLPGARTVDNHIDAATVHAPDVFLLEVAQTFRRYGHQGHLTLTRSSAAFEDLSDLDITLYPHRPLLPRVWQLRDNLTTYDASYVALAEALDTQVLTLDARLSNSPGANNRTLLIHR